jgi:hypothetical protein
MSFMSYASINVEQPWNPECGSLIEPCHCDGYSGLH